MRWWARIIQFPARLKGTFMANRMKLQNQILLVNAAILAGLAFECFRGSPIFAIAIAAIVSFGIANVIFFIRVQKAKKLR